MGHIKTFSEFINEKVITLPKHIAESTYDYLLDNYTPEGDVKIEFNTVDNVDGELTIPVTLSGLTLETEIGNPGEIFSVDIQPELEQYLEPGTYSDIDDEILDEHGVLRVFTDENEPYVTKDGIIRLLDGLLKNVPDPALRKK